MATSLQVLNSAPASVLFEFQSTDTTPVYFMREGAAGIDKDLTSLVPGPLRSFLYRLPPFGWQTPYDLAGVKGRVLRWRLAVENFNYGQLPVDGNVTGLGPALTGFAYGIKVDQGGATGQAFRFQSAVTGAIAMIELSFIRSQNR